MSINQMRGLFLLVMGLGLVPVALSYGVVPEISLPLLYGFSDPDLPTQHILRALMGLYLGMICFWLAGVLRPNLRIAALWNVFVFVTGIALGRVLSLVLDGWPGPLLIFYLIAEIVLAVTALGLIFCGPSRESGAAA